MLFLPTFLLCSAYLAKKECAVPTFSRDPMLKASPVSKHKDRRRIVSGQDEERDRWELQELWGKQHSSPCRTLISSGEAGRQPMSLVHAFTVNVARPSVGSRSPQDPMVSSFCPNTLPSLLPARGLNMREEHQKCWGAFLTVVSCIARACQFGGLFQR